jgi:hypothetical protein
MIDMEKEKLEIVLEDILDELKTVNKVMQQHKQQTTELQERVLAFEEIIDKLNPPIIPSIEPFEAAINAGIVELKQLIQQQPKHVTRQWRLLLFPEHYIKEYYTAIFRLIMWMTLVFTATFFFALGKQALENSKEVKLIQLKNDQYKNAWQYMYHKESKQGKKKMDDAWQKSLNPNFNK